jgi:hypothetical protein
VPLPRPADGAGTVPRVEHGTDSSATSIGPTPGGAPPKGRRSPLPLIIGVILAVVLVVLGLGFAGVIPGFHPFSGGAPGASSASHFSLTFTESGLPSGTAWSVAVQGASSQSSSTTSLVFEVGNGAWTYTVGAIAGYSATPATGSVTVAGAAVSVPITFVANSHPKVTTYAVTFAESGLATGTDWSVSVNGTTNGGTASTIAFTLPNGTYPYSIGAVGGLLPSPASGTVAVSGAAAEVTVHFAASVSGAYTVSFSEAGLPVGTPWSVTLAGTPASGTGGTLQFSEPNGSYSYTVGAVSGYVASPASGSVSVHGAPTAVSIFYSSGVAGASVYPVFFDQTGLPNNSTWSVALTVVGPSGPATTVAADAEGAAIELSVPAGSYHWTVSANSSSSGAYVPAAWAGSVTVASPSVSVPIVFTGSPATSTLYPLTLKETGLPSPSTWYAFTGANFSSAAAGSSIVFDVPNGTYYVSAFSSVSGYNLVGYPFAFPIVLMTGAAASLTLAFEQFTPITFNASGIGGSAWSVEIVNGSATTVFGISGSSLDQIPLANGTYGFEAYALGFSPAPGSGTFTVAGTPFNVSLAFTPITTYNVTFVASGLPSGAGWNAQVFLDGVLSYLATDYLSTTGTTFSVNLPAGNYTWMASPNSLNWYWPSPGAGGFTVVAAPLQVNVTFVHAPATYPVEFGVAEAFGGNVSILPNGTAWGVIVDGVTFTTTGDVIEVFEPNGTHAFQIVAPLGYSVTPVFGNVTVNSTLAHVTGAFVLLAFYVGPFGLPTAGAERALAPTVGTVELDSASFLPARPA